MTDTTSFSRRNGHPPGRLREMPPFGAPDAVDTRPAGEPTADTDDPRGVYLPPPEVLRQTG